MACIAVQHRQRGEVRIIEEGTSYPVEWQFTGQIIANCGPQDASQDFDHLWTEEGFMVGNAIKKVTNALGIKQCLACRGRQARYNQVGLDLQQRVKELFT